MCSREKRKTKRHLSWCRGNKERRCLIVSFFFLFKHKNSCSLCQQVGFKTSLLSLLLLCLKKQNNSRNINPEFLQSIVPDTLDNCKYIPNFLRPFSPSTYFFPNKMAKRKREHKDYAIKWEIHLLTLTSALPLLGFPSYFLDKNSHNLQLNCKPCIRHYQTFK